MSECDVLIVGAGPVGAMAGLLLVNKGLRVTIIEREPGVVQSPRALGYLPHVNGMLEEAGVLEDVRETGWAVREGPVWRRASDHTPIGAFNSFASPSENSSQGPPKLGFRLGQHKFAEIVLKRFQEKGGKMLFNHTFESLDQHDKKVHITAKSSEGNTHSFAASFVLGADGGRSSVRKALNVPFEGFTHDVNFVAINLRYSEMLSTGFGEVSFMVDPQEKVEDSAFAVIVRVDDADGIWRVAYGDAAHFSDEELRARVHMKLKKILPLHPSESQYELLQAQPYRIHQRCAATYTTGRVLLAGDSAHLNNPVGGLGLNTGLLDARAAVEAITDCMSISKGTSTNLSSSPDQEAEITTRLKAYSDARRSAFLEFTNPVSIDNLRRLMEQSDEAESKLRTSFFGSLDNPTFQKGMYQAMNKIAAGVPGF